MLQDQMFLFSNLSLQFCQFRGCDISSCEHHHKTSSSFPGCYLGGKCFGHAFYAAAMPAPKLSDRVKMIKGTNFTVPHSFLPEL